MSLPIPASATTGFFQQLPTIPPQFTHNPTNNTVSADDAIIPRLLTLYLPSTAHSAVSTKLHSRARLVLADETTSLTVSAELNPPHLRPLTTFGAENKSNPLITSPAWKEIKRRAITCSMLSQIYNNQLLLSGKLQQRLDGSAGREGVAGHNLRLEQHIVGHVVGTADATVGCPMSMTDGAAALLLRHLGRGDEGGQKGFGEVVQETFRRLVSNDPVEAWTSGQWMTERSGGSDVSGIQTFARRVQNGEGGGFDAVGLPLGPWVVDGFKWFSSATDCEVTVMLAKTERGISTFLCPTRRRVEGNATATEPNGIRIIRLKNKLGTKALPTAELELKGTRGWLVGKEGEGVKEISAILNTTRLGTGIGSCASWSRSLAISRAFSRIRRARGKLLQDHPGHARWMAGETVKYTAAVHLTYFGSALLGATQQGRDATTQGIGAERLIPKDKLDIQILLRMLGPVLKSRTTVNAVHGVRECLESLGGVGYCENEEDGGVLNIARIYRDVNVNPVWEGTVNVMGEDIVRVLTANRHTGLEDDGVFARWLHSTLAICRATFDEECKFVDREWQALTALTKDADHEQLLYSARQILSLMETIFCSCLLMFDAVRDGDERATAIARRWVASKTPDALYVREHVRTAHAIDRLIFLSDSPGLSKAHL